MIKSLFYNFHIRKNNFAKALSYKQKSKISKSAWSFYRLGMYKTVTQIQHDTNNALDILAKAVSHAACGQYKEAGEFIEVIKVKKEWHKHLTLLADALAPYMPYQALEIVEFAKSPTTLYAALLLKTGEQERARQLLEDAIVSKESRKKPEMFLYLSNALGNVQANQKLTLFNKFLLYYNLPKVRLKDKICSLTPQNIDSRVVVEKVNGPLVSVLMTTFETGWRLDTAIESILNQSYTNLELYIVDDASSDETPKKIEGWVKKDTRIKFIKLETNVGTYVAKNIALLQASGEFVTCHDSDDWSHPQKIEMQVAPLLKNKNLIATTSCWVRIDDEGFYYARPVHPLMRINPSSPLFRKKEVLKHAGIWDCVRTGADSEFLARLRLVFGKKAIKKINKPLAFGSHRDDSLMNATGTGYCKFGLSPQRLAYWEAWNAWHIEELKKSKKPFISLNMLQERQFGAPEKIIVPKSDIQEVISVFNL